jgi:Fur family ferric uptake transcriptional regulator
MARRKHKGAADTEALNERLETYMSRKGLRSTAQRRLIAETFFSGPSHVSIEDLLADVRKRDPQVGYATVYRTLKLFTESGIAAERHFGDGPSRYEVSDEGAGDHHDHFICEECGKIIEFHDERVEVLQEAIANTLGFIIERHKHEIYGTCAECQARSKR